MAKKSYYPRTKKAKKKKPYTPPTLERKKKSYSSPSIENNMTKVPFRKRFSNYYNDHLALPSAGSVLSLIFALLVLSVVFAKISGAEYTPISYWLEVFEEMPIKIDLEMMFNTIPYINLPLSLNFLEGIANFFVSVANLFFGCVLSLINSLQVILYFLRHLLMLGVA